MQYTHICLDFKMRTLRRHALLLFLIIISLSLSAQTKKKPIVIQEQGSFAVGGTVITNPGTFNPYNQTLEGQTLHGDHAYVFYQIRTKPANIRW